jgi:hypothetical protein
MKFFNHQRQKTANLEANRTAKTDTHPEPLGHVHPNYVHWTWFRPHDLNRDVNQ